MTGVSVVANAAFTPPRMEVTCTVPTGNVMKTATLNRIVNGVATPTLTQPGTGLDTQLVYDYLAPYGVPVSYEFVTDYIAPTGPTVWDETWANLTAWAGVDSSFTVSGGKVIFSPSDAAGHTITRALTTGSYRVVVSSLAATTTVGVYNSWFELPGQVWLQVNAAGMVVINDLIAGTQTVTSISASSPITIDLLGTSVSVSGTGGSWSSSARTSTDISQVRIYGNVPAGTGTFTVGEVKVTSYPATTHLDVTSTAATLAPSQAWLIHPSNPALSVPISSTDRSAIAVQNLGTISQASASTLHQILGQSLPIETHSGPRYGNTLQVALKARTAAHEAALNGILADSTPLLFRFPPSFDAGFDEGFYSFGQVQRSRIAQRYGSELRQFVADITRVQQPTVAVQNAGWSWAALAAAFPTWAAVAQAYNTWADVLTNNRKPGY